MHGGSESTIREHTWHDQRARKYPIATRQGGNDTHSSAVLIQDQTARFQSTRPIITASRSCSEVSYHAIELELQTTRSLELQTTRSIDQIKGNVIGSHHRARTLIFNSRIAGECAASNAKRLIGLRYDEADEIGGRATLFGVLADRRRREDSAAKLVSSDLSTDLSCSGSRFGSIADTCRSIRLRTSASDHPLKIKTA